VQVDPGWLAACVEAALSRPDFAAFGGPIIPWFPVPPDPVLLECFPPLRNGFCGIDYGPEARLLGPDEHIWGANMAYRVDRVRGLRFDPNLGRCMNSQRTSEDSIYLSQVRDRGGRVLWCPGMKVRHYVDPYRMTLKYLKTLYRDM